MIKISYCGEKKSVKTGFPEGQCLLLNDEIYVLTSDKDWWHGSVEKKQIRHLGTIVDGQLDHVALSSHYGVLVCVQVPERRLYRLYQVMVSPKRQNPEKSSSGQK